jgi:hypothetical protein
MRTPIAYEPIFVTGAERSGSTLIARILKESGCWSGECNTMFENSRIHSLHHQLQRDETIFPCTAMPVNWRDEVLGILKDEEWHDEPWFVKGSVLTQHWPIWNFAFPDAKWLIIRRRTADVIESCMKTGYMKTFRNGKNLKQLGLEDERAGWLWWIHQYEKRFVEMIQAGLNCRIVWPDRMVPEPVYNPPVQFQQIQETIKWLGLDWNENIPEIISPLLEKSRRK